jgi:hypothetical protein
VPVTPGASPAGDGAAAAGALVGEQSGSGAAAAVARWPPPAADGAASAGALVGERWRNAAEQIEATGPAQVVMAGTPRMEQLRQHAECLACRHMRGRMRRPP